MDSRYKETESYKLLRVRTDVIPWFREISFYLKLAIPVYYVNFINEKLAILIEFQEMESVSKRAQKYSGKIVVKDKRKIK